MKVPKEVKNILLKLEDKGFEAYVVGGCVRDILVNKKPQDWDVTTSARPEEIQKVFPKSFYENKFLTVTVQTNSKDPSLKEIEVTTYRTEAKYTDKRHPNEVGFASSLKKDLARRDFTVNAMVLGLKPKSLNQEFKDRHKIINAKYILIDLFCGQEDLKNKIIRAVGNPEQRFSEDALRMLRAARLAVALEEGWRIEAETAKAIREKAFLIEVISKERIKDELIKIISSERAAQGIELLRSSGLLKYIIPELEEGYGVSQNKHHIYECYEHSLRSLDYAARNNYNAHVRLAALLHDIAKPRTKQGEGMDSTFYGHEIVGAKIASQILNRLKFSKKDIEKVVRLVRYHLFYYNVGEVSESSVRRLLVKVGPENIEELLQVRMADRIGSGVPKAEPYKLRHLKYVIERVSRDPISVRMLKVSGNDVMEILKIKPGPKVGQMLDVLLGYVLSDPKKNERKFLEKEIKRLGELPEKELISLVLKAKKERETLETKRDKMTKDKYWVT